MIKEIGEFILQQTSQTHWERDINFFIGHKPIMNINGKKLEEIPRIVCILENTPADTIGDLPDRADKPVQIWNRNESFFRARDDAFEFHSFLHGSSQWQLPLVSSGVIYTAMIIDSMGTPAPIENPDSKGWFVFSANYMFRIAE